MSTAFSKGQYGRGSGITPLNPEMEYNSGTLRSQRFSTMKTGDGDERPQSDEDILSYHAKGNSLEDGTENIHVHIHEEAELSWTKGG
jgi:hypothetical protein